MFSAATFVIVVSVAVVLSSLSSPKMVYMLLYPSDPPCCEVAVTICNACMLCR
jgi:hypothetical protein